MTKHNTGLLIICRVNSKRLNKKILKTINGKPLLEILILRLLKKFKKKQIVICSSISSRNNQFMKLSKKFGVKLFYGNDKDIFSRMINSAKKFKFNNVVRITGDNPLTDIDAIRKMLNSHIKKKSDYTYTTNLMVGTRPEIFKVQALRKCRNLAIDRFSSEYMTYFFLRKKKFHLNRCKFKEIIKDQNKISVTIDYNKEFLLMKKILKKKGYFLKHNETLKFLEKTKSIKKILYKRFVPLITDKYNVKLKSDKNLDFIDLKEFGFK